MSRIATIDFPGGEIIVIQTQTYGGSKYHWNCSCGDEELDLPNRTQGVRQAQDHADRHNEEN